MLLIWWKTISPATLLPACFFVNGLQKFTAVAINAAMVYVSWVIAVSLAITPYFPDTSIHFHLRRDDNLHAMDRSQCDTVGSIVHYPCLNAESRVHAYMDLVYSTASNLRDD